MMLLHTFEQGFCSVCGESLDYLADGKLRDAAIIGPQFPIDPNQGTFQLSMAVYA